MSVHAVSVSTHAVPSSLHAASMNVHAISMSGHAASMSARTRSILHNTLHLYVDCHRKAVQARRIIHLTADAAYILKRGNSRNFL